MLQAWKSKLAIASSSRRSTKLLDAVKAGEKQYHFIEIMGCLGGCVNGGGQPIIPAEGSQCAGSPVWNGLRDCIAKIRIRRFANP